MKVIMNVQTIYSGNTVVVGEIVDVNKETGNRWISRGIADVAVDVPEPEEDNEPDVKADETAATDEVDESSDEDTAATDYSMLKPKELYELCKAHGLDVEAKQSADYYIEALTAPDKE